jgi:LETM1 and EF-hand domain-containing protein 1, mitochondrial
MAASGSISSETAKFAELYKKARITGENISVSDLEEVCHSLKDSLTVENLERAHLVSLCKYIGVNAFGTDSFLRYQIRNFLKTLYADDKIINSEGVDSMFVSELEQACRLRGLFYPGIDVKAMRDELKLWLKLHIEKGIPSVILILSRALSQNLKLYRPEEALKQTIMSLSDAIVNEAEIHQQEISGSEAICFKQKLEAIEHQEDMIEAELAQAAELEVANIDKNTSGYENYADRNDLKTISDAISVMSSTNPVERELKQLQELKEQLSEFKIDSEDLETLSNHKLKESKAAEILGKKIEYLINQLENELQSLRDRLGERLNLISADDKGQISLDQLNTVFKLIRQSPNEFNRLEKIIKTFDTDQDGKVFISDILAMSKKIEEHEGHGVVRNK